VNYLCGLRAFTVQNISRDDVMGGYGILNQPNIEVYSIIVDMTMRVATV